MFLFDNWYNNNNYNLNNNNNQLFNNNNVGLSHFYQKIFKISN
jgi:hypothetical protein